MPDFEDYPVAEAVLSSPTASSTLDPFNILLELDRRIRERAPTSTSSAQLSEIKGQLAARLGSWNLLFSMDDVAEIIPFPRGITQVPGVKRWLLGIANLRGRVISVSDLRDFLTERPTPQLPGCQIVVVRAGEWDYGLLVEEIVGMRHFGPQHRLPSLENIEESLQPFVGEAFWSDNQCWMVFNTGALLTQPQFLNAAI